MEGRVLYAIIRHAASANAAPAKKTDAAGAWDVWQTTKTNASSTSILWTKCIQLDVDVPNTRWEYGFSKNNGHVFPNE